MKLPQTDLSLTVLIIANLVPLAGVVLLGWDVSSILLLYWGENLVIGFYNVWKMAIARSDDQTPHALKFLLIPFFCFHFGAFCAGHGFFLVMFMNWGKNPGDYFFEDMNAPGPLVFMQLLVKVITFLLKSRPAGLELPLLALFISHGVSFVRNYLMEKEYASLTTHQVMMQPYKRIVILHIAIVTSGILVMKFDSLISLLFILILLKIGMDVWLHNKEHRG